MTAVPRTGLLVFGTAAGPVLWALQLGVLYTWTNVLCGRLSVLLYLFTIVCLAITGLALVIALRSWRMVRGDVAAPPRIHHRSRTLAYAGILSSSYFLLVILATAYPMLVVDACRF